MNNNLYARRLFDRKHFDQILKYNKDSMKYWLDLYPNHEKWIDTVIEGLKKDSYSKMAFGLFKHDDSTTRSNQLYSSVIVSKSPFTPYLELKNLIYLNDDDSEENIVEFQRECYRVLIDYVKKFAESRGYPKLVSEVYNRNKSDHDLIKSFIECDFVITGNQNRRYSGKDEIAFLSCDLNVAYCYDPYDNDASVEWIINSYVSSANLDKSKNSGSLYIYWKGLELPTPLPVKQFFVQHSSHPNLSIFNITNHFVVIPEFLHAINDKADIDRLDYRFECSDHLYIFNFSSNGLGLQLEKLITEGHSHFTPHFISQPEISQLLYPQYFNKKTAKAREYCNLTHKIVPYESMQGFLTSSDPKRFTESRYNAICKCGYDPVYIKLGPKGKYLDSEKYLVLAYISELFDSQVMNIWSVCRLSTSYTVDLNDNNTGSNDADFLFNTIHQFEDDIESIDDTILWTKDEFGKHNQYNASNQVVCYCIKELYDLRKSPIEISKITSDKKRLECIGEEIDIYLTESEIQALLNIIEKADIKPQRNVNPTKLFPCSFTYVHSSPDEGKPYISSEDNILKNICNARRAFFQQFDPHYNVSYIDFENLFLKQISGIFHFSGHTQNGNLCLINSVNKKSVEVPSAELRGWLSKKHVDINLFIICACSSCELAKICSENHRYAIGFHNESLGDDQVKTFSQFFYNNLIEADYSNPLYVIFAFFIHSFSVENVDIKPCLWLNGYQVDIPLEAGKYETT